MENITTILIKNDNTEDSIRFLEFARTLPYIEVIDEQTNPQFNPSVVETLKKSENNEDLIECKDANDMFNKLGI